MNSVSHSPPRPLGLSLAILSCVFLFTLLPLAELGLKLIIQDRFSRFDNLAIPDPDNPDQLLTPLASGGNITLVTETELIIQVVLGVAFLVVCVFAWRGRPSWVRYILFAMVLILTALSAAVLIAHMTRPPSLEEGLTSADGFFQQARCGQLALTVLVPLYVVWYMNRAPARAFYRGYYLTPPNKTQSPDE